ncbi:hypothetical protein [Actinokineospora sp.]
MAALADAGIGTAPEDAWGRVEAARGMPVPDTPEQRKWVAGLM